MPEKPNEDLTEAGETVVAISKSLLSHDIDEVLHLLARHMRRNNLQTSRAKRSLLPVSD